MDIERINHSRRAHPPLPATSTGSLPSYEATETIPIYEAPEYCSASSSSYGHNSLPPSSHECEVIPCALSCSKLHYNPEAHAIDLPNGTHLIAAHGPHPFVECDIHRHSNNVDLHTLNDYPSNGRCLFLLENLSLICLCIRIPRFIEVICGPITHVEVHNTLSHAQSDITFRFETHTANSNFLAAHRTLFHGDIVPRNVDSSRINWRCFIPLCHLNLLPRRLDTYQIPDRVSKLYDALDSYATLLPLTVDEPVLALALTELCNLHPRNVVISELFTKYSQLTTVLTEAYNSGTITTLIRELKNTHNHTH